MELRNLANAKDLNEMEKKTIIATDSIRCFMENLNEISNGELCPKIFISALYNNIMNIFIESGLIHDEFLKFHDEIRKASEEHWPIG